MSAFCAICTGDRGPFVQRPLGRQSALVTVCAECDTAPARSRQGPVIGVPLPPEGQKSEVMRQRITVGNRKLRAAASARGRR